MNQICKVCGEPAAGFHFGAFTCEGCKSFFGRSYNNLSSISECKNGGKCIIDKKNRTTCKACRLRKCYTVGMSKGGSRYGRRSNWFKIHCLLQEQQQQAVEAANKAGTVVSSSSGFSDLATAAAVAAQQHFHHHQQQQQQQHSPHFVPHMSGLLSYPNYLPEMSPFLSAAAVASTRHPADSSAAAAAAAALPFFNMMNGLPGPQSTYPLPPSHLFFPGYHPAAAAAQTTADVAYRSDVFQHRPSIDSVTESQRHSPANRSTHSHHSQVHEERSSASARQSPLLCVSGDEDQLSPQQSSTSSLGSHEVQSAITIRALQVVSSPKQGTTPNSLPVALAVTPPKSQPCSPQGITRAQTASPPPHIALAGSMQALSPVSVCSTNAEIMPSVPNSRNLCSKDDHQDSPMDLSMKASQSSAHSFDASVGESDVCEEELRHTMVGTTTRRKFYQLSEQGSDTSSDDTAEDMVKRQKLATESQGYNRFPNNPTSLRGIFVCV